ncbi:MULTISPECIES: aminoglycoside adenylyltransferase domain-containing protein [Clostridia]|uniref:aminoglycoside adenylyltransferase domain-containing protein n=1 Tax=Clostridia TaxID=186801 RepID=UPI000EA385EE|nr:MULTISPECIES: aminoglycoside adenylyltransferase domain-containing protein [Clostridia]NBJ70420.1 DUF4111 domain-containing protein [Roseburia sp. 1XD42-34]RKI76248.1 DUF4111 domain-containing protein [Clostridium sp. 1xD42-85]
MEHEIFLNRFAESCQEILQVKFVGVYLHGSLAMDCYQRGKSDIDLLIIVNMSLHKQEKKQLIYKFMRLEADYQVQIETSIINIDVLFPFQFPTPFELHYSAFHKPRYEKEDGYLCDQGTDPDLAAHLVVTLHRGKTITGLNKEEVIPSIDTKYFIYSILNDIEDAQVAIIQSPGYYILNLCRTLYYFQEGVIASKLEGGEWAKQAVPLGWKLLISQALDYYQQKLINPSWDEKYLVNFATYMIKRLEMEK